MDDGTTYGYVRVSTAHQSIGRQVAKMDGMGIPRERQYVDRASGKDMDREMWSELVGRLSAGDLLVVDSLDRLGRDYDDVTGEWRRLTREVGCDICCLDLEFMDSRKFRALGGLGRVMEDNMLAMLAYVAQSEREKMLQRQREGIAVARAQGRTGGRPRAAVDDAELRLVADMEAYGDITASQAADRLGISRRTYCRRRDALREMDAADEGGAA